MLRRRQVRRLQSFVRAATSWLLLGTYVATASGLPLPQPATGSSESPYPCQGGRCGCRSAEQCWKSCCCHTAGERLAWARRNGVTPPEHLVAADREEVKPACGRGCCSQSKGAGVRSPESEVRKSAHSLSLLAAARCRGESAAQHSVPLCLVPPLPLCRALFEPRVQAAFVSLPPTSPSASFAPPVPPPRIA